MNTQHLQNPATTNLKTLSTNDHVTKPQSKKRKRVGCCCTGKPAYVVYGHFFSFLGAEQDITQNYGIPPIPQKPLLDDAQKSACRQWKKNRIDILELYKQVRDELYRARRGLSSSGKRESINERMNNTNTNTNTTTSLSSETTIPLGRDPNGAPDMALSIDVHTPETHKLDRHLDAIRLPLIRGMTLFSLALDTLCIFGYFSSSWMSLGNKLVAIDGDIPFTREKNSFTTSLSSTSTTTTKDHEDAYIQTPPPFVSLRALSTSRPMYTSLRLRALVFLIITSILVIAPAVTVGREGLSLYTNRVPPLIQIGLMILSLLFFFIRDIAPRRVRFEYEHVVGVEENALPYMLPLVLEAPGKCQFMISYAWGGRHVSFARDLASLLPDCWIDTAALAPGDAIAVETASAVRNARVLIILLTCEYVRSANCSTEIRAALLERKWPRLTIIFADVNGCNCRNEMRQRCPWRTGSAQQLMEAFKCVDPSAIIVVENAHQLIRYLDQHVLHAQGENDKAAVIRWWQEHGLPRTTGKRVSTNVRVVPPRVRSRLWLLNKRWTCNCYRKNGGIVSAFRQLAPDVRSVTKYRLPTYQEISLCIALFILSLQIINIGIYCAPSVETLVRDLSLFYDACDINNDLHFFIFSLLPVVLSVSAFLLSPKLDPEQLHDPVLTPLIAAAYACAKTKAKNGDILMENMANMNTPIAPSVRRASRTSSTSKRRDRMDHHLHSLSTEHASSDISTATKTKEPSDFVTIGNLQEKQHLPPKLLFTEDDTALDILSITPSPTSPSPPPPPSTPPSASPPPPPSSVSPSPSPLASPSFEEEEKVVHEIKALTVPTNNKQEIVPMKHAESHINLFTSSDRINSSAFEKNTINTTDSDDENDDTYKNRDDFVIEQLLGGSFTVELVHRGENSCIATKELIQSLSEFLGRGPNDGDDAVGIHVHVKSFTDMIDTHRAKSMVLYVFLLDSIQDVEAWYSILTLNGTCTDLAKIHTRWPPAINVLLVHEDVFGYQYHETNTITANLMRMVSWRPRTQRQPQQDLSKITTTTLENTKQDSNTLNNKPTSTLGLSNITKLFSSSRILSSVSLQQYPDQEHQHGNLQTKIKSNPLHTPPLSSPISESIPIPKINSQDAITLLRQHLCLKRTDRNEALSRGGLDPESPYVSLAEALLDSIGRKVGAVIIKANDMQTMQSF